MYKVLDNLGLNLNYHDSAAVQILSAHPVYAYTFGWYMKKNAFVTRQQ